MIIEMEQICEETPKVKLWQGTQDAYDALEEKESDVAYIITEPATISYASDLSLSTISISEAINDVATTWAPYRPSSYLYTCDYCGSDYHSEGGFVPPCQNCGARLRRAY